MMILSFQKKKDGILIACSFSKRWTNDYFIFPKRWTTDYFVFSNKRTNDYFIFPKRWNKAYFIFSIGRLCLNNTRIHCSKVKKKTYQIQVHNLM
jgi:hypothetical protein